MQERGQIWCAVFRRGRKKEKKSWERVLRDPDHNCWFRFKYSGQRALNIDPDVPPRETEGGSAPHLMAQEFKRSSEPAQRWRVPGQRTPASAAPADPVNAIPLSHLNSR